MSIFDWTCPTCYTVVSTFDNTPPICGVCDATMEPAEELESQAGAAQPGERK